MKDTGKILAAGCLMAVLSMSFISYAAPVQTSPREGVAVVAATASAYSNVAISQVTNYVNVRTEPNTSSEIVGKIYNNCAATILASVDGEGGKWYRIQSGTVTGYIKAEYFITGSEAEKIAKEIGTVYVTINTTTLRLREAPSTDSRTLTLLSEDAEYISEGDEGDFVKIQVDAGLSGYVHKDYVEERVEFKMAVSLEEEAQQKAEEERIKKEADEAIAKMNQLRAEAGIAEKPVSSGESETTAPAESESVGIIAANPDGINESENGNTGGETLKPADPTAGQSQNQDDGQNSTQTSGETSGSTESGGSQAGETAGPGSTAGPGAGNSTTADQSAAGSPDGPGAGPGSSGTQGGAVSAELTSATRTAIVAYAKQFLGNPYVYGGTSLTDGADCSGFTMRIFEHFGISTGRTSRDQAANGKEIPISSIQPGDLLFYANGDYINHVALYIGGGQIIHASTSKTGIVISTAYYRTPYKAVTFLE